MFLGSPEFKVGFLVIAVSGLIAAMALKVANGPGMFSGSRNFYFKADNAGGGRSRVLDLDTIRTDVAERLGEARLKLFQDEPAPWQLAPYLGGGVAWRPVLTERAVCWRRYTIDLALTREGASISEEMLRALDEFERVVTDSTGTVDFMMREGELLFSDNTRTIHARTPLADPATSTRLMIRSWIRTS